MISYLNVSDNVMASSQMKMGQSILQNFKKLSKDSSNFHQQSYAATTPKTDFEAKQKNQRINFKVLIPFRKNIGALNACSKLSKNILKKTKHFDSDKK